MQFSIEFEYMPTRSCTVPLPSAAVNPSVQSTPQVIRNLEPVKGAVKSVVLEAGHLLLGMTVGLGVLVDEGDAMLDVLEAVGSDEDELLKKLTLPLRISARSIEGIAVPLDNLLRRTSRS